MGALRGRGRAPCISAEPCCAESAVTPLLPAAAVARPRLRQARRVHRRHRRHGGVSRSPWREPWRRGHCRHPVRVLRLHDDVDELATHPRRRTHPVALLGARAADSGVPRPGRRGGRRRRGQHVARGVPRSFTLLADSRRGLRPRASVVPVRLEPPSGRRYARPCSRGRDAWRRTRRRADPAVLHVPRSARPAGP